jgi:hypothetical protein
VDVILTFSFFPATMAAKNAIVPSSGGTED